MTDVKPEYLWPEVFDNKNLNGRPNAALCADGLCAWGNCMAGAKPHPNFGEVMAAIGHRLGVSAVPDSLMKKSEEYLGKKGATI